MDELVVTHPESAVNPELFRDYCASTGKAVRDAAVRLVKTHLRRQRALMPDVFELAIGDCEWSVYPLALRIGYSLAPESFPELDNLCGAVHLLQLSTFVIDDILDIADKRSHSDSLWRRHGIDHAILTGEVLQSIALKAISDELQNDRFLHRNSILHGLIGVVESVYLGQRLDLCYSACLEVRVRDYLRMVVLTTAQFISVLARSGALLANRSPATAKILGKFGYYYGIALQIFDDLVDLTVHSALTGKPFALDLKNRRMRLPLIVGLRRSKDADLDFIKSFLNAPSQSTEGMREVLALIDRLGALAESERIALGYLTKAAKVLQQLEPGFTKECLRYLVDDLISGHAQMRSWSALCSAPT